MSRSIKNGFGKNDNRGKKMAVVCLAVLLVLPSLIQAQDNVKGHADEMRFFYNLSNDRSLRGMSTPVSSKSDLLVYMDTRLLETFKQEFNGYVDSSASKGFETIKLSSLGHVYLKLLKKMYGDTFAISNESYKAYQDPNAGFVNVFATYKLVSKKASGYLNVTFAVKDRAIKPEEITFVPFDYIHTDFAENLSYNDLEKYRGKDFNALLALLRKNNNQLKDKALKKLEGGLNENHFSNPKYFSSRLYCADNSIHMVAVYELKDSSNFVVFNYKSANNRFELNDIKVVSK